MADKNKTQATEPDILDSIKSVQRAIKAKMLVERIVDLQKIAREINECKEEMNVTLEELGLSERDIKRVIDYVNELPSVKLSEAAKKRIREEVQADLLKDQEKKEKEVHSSENFEKMLMPLITTASTHNDMHYVSYPVGQRGGGGALHPRPNAYYNEIYCVQDKGLGVAWSMLNNSEVKFQSLNSSGGMKQEEALIVRF